MAPQWAPHWARARVPFDPGRVEPVIKLLNIYHRLLRKYFRYLRERFDFIFLNILRDRLTGFLCPPQPIIRPILQPFLAVSGCTLVAGGSYVLLDRIFSSDLAPDSSITSVFSSVVGYSGGLVFGCL